LYGVCQEPILRREKNAKVKTALVEILVLFLASSSN
jgi:hypothetical protein